MKAKIVLILMLCIAQRGISQLMYSDSVLVDVSAIMSKKDTGSVNSYVLGFKAGFSPVNSLRSVKIAFADQNDNELKVWGEFQLREHPDGYFYFESSSQGKIILHGNQLKLVIPLANQEYLDYDRLLIAYTSISNVSEIRSFNITKL